MIDFIFTAFLYASVAASLYLILTKYRLITWLQSNSVFPFKNIANCVLCSCFWLNMIMALLGVFFGMDLITLLCPFAGASISRFLIG